jgi:chaperonin cofactor prefoldin
MKTCIALILLLAAGTALAQTIAPTPPTIESLDREVDELSLQLRTANEQVADLRERVDTLEKRLGETYRPISPFDTVERRLDDLQKDLDRLAR